MKKFLLWLCGILAALVLLVYIFVFSPIGNMIIKPIIQSQINKHSPLPLVLERFSLGLTGAQIVLTNGQKLIIDLHGDYNLFTLGVDFDLLVDANDISLFGELAGIELAGAFEVRAKAQGKIFDTLTINATSDIARSKSSLQATLYDLKPTQITADITALRINELLAMLGQKPYISGVLGLQADISGTQDKEPNFSGQAALAITQGGFSQELIQKDFDIAIPRTSWNANLSAIFDMDSIKHNLAFNANVGKIISSGITQLSSLLTKSTYTIDLSDISAFTPLVGTKVRGALRTNGEMIGGSSQMKISGKSDVAGSSTTYTALLESFAPKKISFDIKHLKIEQLFSMLYLPKYATGLEDASGEVWDLDKGISAQVISSLKGVIMGDVIKREFDLAMPNTPFSYKSNARLLKGVGEADFTLESTLANLALNPIAIDLSSTTIATPYTITIPSLKALKFLTGIELAGKLEADGKIKIAESIQADFHTQSLGGQLDAKLKGKELSAKLHDVDTISLLKMLQYPQIFSAKANGDLSVISGENGANGTMRLVLSNGHFTKNDFTRSLQQYTNLDITGLLFNGVGFESQIDNSTKLNAKFGAKSGDFSMQGDNILIDLERSTINAKLKTAIKQDSVDVLLQGAIGSPRVEVDFSELARKKATQAIQKELDRHIDKHKDKAIDALKGLFK